MFQVTRKVEYSLIALVYMHGKTGTPVSAREIAEHNAIPLSLTANILKSLARNGLIATRRGATGGYTLEQAVGKIRLGEVVSAVEGPMNLTPCCEARETGCCGLIGHCSIRSSMRMLNQQLVDFVRNMTLDEFIRLGGVQSEIA